MEHLTILKSELEERCQKNPSYSLRSFALQLGVNPGGLSRIINGKTPLSLKMAKKIGGKLNFEPEKKIRFENSVYHHQKGRTLKKVSRELKHFSEKKGEKIETGLDIEAFKAIAHWYHYAILELTYSDDFQDNPRYISRALGISEIKAKLALERLFTLGLLIRRDGKVYKSSTYLTTRNKELTTVAHRTHQREIREKSLESLERDAIDTRSMTSVTMNIDPDLINEAKERILEFNRNLCEFLESKSRRKIYALEVSLFPLEKGMEQ